MRLASGGWFRTAERLATKIGYLEKWLLIGVVVGVLSGFFALAFYHLLMFVTGFTLYLLGVRETIDPAHDLAVELIVEDVVPLAAPLVTAGGALLSAFLVYRFAPEAEGHGTDAAVNAFHRRAGIIHFRVPIIKALASAATIGSGGSGGIEGPSVQMGAGIGSLVARVFRLSPEDRRIALIAGMAAALSVLFHAPLGSALFAVEVLYRRDLEARAFIPAFIASIVAFSVTCPIIGFKPLLPKLAADPVTLYSLQGLAAVALLGVFTAPFALLYIKSFYLVREVFDTFFKRYGLPIYLKPVLGGLVAGSIGVLLPHVLGPGRGVARYFIECVQEGNLEDFVILDAPLWLSLIGIAVAKILATSFSIGSGGSGGVFAPGLLVGALVGASFGHTIGTMIAPIDPAIYSYIGMAAFFGAAGKVPLAVSVMVSEMGGNYLLLAPALLSACIARLLTGEATIYESQLERRVRSEIISAETLYELIALRGHRVNLTVSDLVDRSVHPVSTTETIAKVFDRLRRLRGRVLPVVDGDSRPVAVVDVSDLDLLAMLTDEEPHIPISALKLPKPHTVEVNAPIEEALARMLKAGTDYLIVVDKQGRYIGVLEADDIASTLSHILHEKVRPARKHSPVVKSSGGSSRKQSKRESTRQL